MKELADIAALFPELTRKQQDQLVRLLPLYSDWNNRINVVSRKDIDQLYLHHVQHSLAIAKFIHFVPGTAVIDVGTGGGFPGIPLAIMFPDSHFTLIDSIGKKITVVQAVVDALQLQNVTAMQTRVETVKEKFDFVVSRAVTALPVFTGWVWNKIRRNGKNTLPNGVIYLKGGDLAGEIANTASQMKIPPESIQIVPINQWFPFDFFVEKKIVYIPR